MIRTLHGKVSLILLVLFLATAAFNVGWTLFSVRMQLMEADQRLNRGLADYLVKHEFDEGELADAGAKLEHSFSMLMDINPGIELYLLDNTGNILAYSAPPGRVIRDKVTPGPILEYLQGTEQYPILGDDPRSPWKKKPFSAAPVSMEGLSEGFLYIILGGEQHDSFFDLFAGNAILRLSLIVSVTSMLFLFVTAFLLFRKATVRHRNLASSMELFKESGFTSMVQSPEVAGAGPGDDLDTLGLVFAQMATLISKQFEELKDKDRLRSELMSNITHDIRTPLASLQGYIETLSEKQDQLSGPEKKEIMDNAKGLISRLGKLVTELLELAQLDSLDTKPERELFPLADLVNDLLMDHRYSAEDKGVELAVAFNDSTSLVSGNIRLLERAIQNIIGNAIKFTLAGKRVTLGLDRRGDSLVLSVTDEGPGISGEDLPHIFERFYKARATSSADTQEREGFGLGLAIAQRIASLHGTSIEVESQPGSGSTFTIALPVILPSDG